VYRAFSSLKICPSTLEEYRFKALSSAKSIATLKSQRLKEYGFKARFLPQRLLTGKPSSS
jgi:hypothetical protein